ncbi:MarR family winged helix-turn-helix transcriptional regulator [Photorhabdus heterorhabditis]|uniref:MarR family transcriptional regulator n=1 Tax=Photorhabdus heterorhabditis TaxID=880156 RepID=A0A5B0WVJ2_9GAMM|nr:MarR family transcriptional regulator [Photorhabdus heterorhabditis]KAA1190191.1 MarR family transcriptional regulator [Photorhabdus heterorhabditis]KOY63821.1 MarR family transcriptional regulator [Photorhabdus heterorhabditis]MBS9440659.1 MarR family transcriptional regulator [Photorhabdus heterorhabditis]NRN26827.1 MarR family transcriptional regulator [Photorhabdus heterorhabditis subsp. aluminescens]
MYTSLLTLADDTFCLRLQRAARMWRKVSDEELSKLNLSEATTTPLWLINKLGEGLRQRTLADHMGLEGQSLVRLLDQLEGAGLLIRQDDPTDRRAKALYLTDEGRNLAEQAEIVVRNIRARLLDGEPNENLAIVDRVFDKIINAASTASETSE